MAHFSSNFIESHRLFRHTTGTREEVRIIYHRKHTV